MKIPLVIFQGLLLEVMSYELICKKGEPEHYYIYNANVELKIYACLYIISQLDLTCEQYGFRTTSADTDIINSCRESAKRVYKGSSIHRITIEFCDLRGNANLLKNSLKVNGTTENMPFSKGYSDTGSYSLLWNPSIKNINHIQNALFDTWTVTQSKRKFISNGNTSLLLTEKINWDFLAWETNYDGIMVSTADINTFNKKEKLPLTFKSTFYQECEVIKQTESTTTLFIYSCPTSVGVYSCHINISDSCENLELGESVDDATLSSQCTYNFFNASTNTCTDIDPNITVCRKVIKVDLKNDKLANMSSHCKYSDGLCNSTKVLWRYNYNCSFQIVEKHYREEQLKGTILIKYNNTVLILEETRRLCGENVWYTNNESVVVSETKLKCQSKYDSLEMERLQFCVPYLNSILSEQKMEITNFQGVLYYLILATTICVMWYILNVTVNFYSLWTLGTKRTSKGYGHLLNCVSQSLTIRYLLFQGSSSEKNYSNKPSPVSQVYNSVENELYEKPR